MKNKFTLTLCLALLVCCLLSPQALAVTEKNADLLLPAALTVIEDEAFRGSGAKKVYLPDGVTSIGALAFADCKSMTEIRVPASVSDIAPDAFDGHNRTLTIYAPDRSAAKAYANQHGISFHIEKNEYVLPEI
jgi:hypothetical protein